MNDRHDEILRLSKNNEIEEIEKILEEQLHKDPDNVELLLRLSVLELAIPLVDFYRSIYLAGQNTPWVLNLGMNGRFPCVIPRLLSRGVLQLSSINSESIQEVIKK